ncbi:cytochrome P450 4C1-like [Manduca sexta]|uniref:cytochrome P450 4C1-like n=1 Tax=Manduca sexta TaxID=7130 RepID=UPI0018902B0E|nr:cytochrome P450 4C1-like [Manduca sexta]
MKVLEPPSLPGKLPILGHSYILYGDNIHTWNVLKWVSQEALTKGGVITMNIGPRLVYAITDPDDLYTVANSCLLKDYFYNFAKPWLGNGLFSGSGPVWRRHRKLLNPAFNQQVLDGFIGVFNDQSRRLVGQLLVQVGKGSFPHLKYLSVYTLETVFQTVFGVNEKYNDLIGEYLSSIAQMQSIFTERFQKVWLHPDIFYNMSQLKATQDKHVKFLHRFSNMVPRKNRKLQMAKRDINDAQTDGQNANGGKFKPFLDLLLELSNNEEVITDKEIREEVDTFMIAGYDTSSYVLMYTLMAIGTYPQVQEKIYREIQDVLGYSDRDVTKHDLHKLVYLEAVIKETLRLYPIAPIVSKIFNYPMLLSLLNILFLKNLLQKEKLCEPQYKHYSNVVDATFIYTHVAERFFIIAKNYTVPAGCSVFLLFWGMHHHSIWGPDAEQFNPERWLDSPTLSTNLKLFAGFSIGKRNCIAKTFAMMSMKTTITHLLRHYKVNADISKITFEKIDRYAPTSLWKCYKFRFKTP